jgi:hypothetical protein
MEKGNKELLQMLSLTEEINGINTKVRQLVEDLHGTQGVLINLQELTAKLNEKVNGLNGSVESYKPKDVVNTGDNDISQASYNNGGEHSRINFGDVTDIDQPLHQPTTPPKPPVSKEKPSDYKVASKVNSSSVKPTVSVKKNGPKKPPVKQPIKTKPPVSKPNKRNMNPLKRFQNTTNK